MAQYGFIELVPFLYLFLSALFLNSCANYQIVKGYSAIYLLASLLRLSPLCSRWL
jgi:hypothetical protein